MMTEQQQEQAARYVLGDLSAAEEHDFTAQLRGNPELREFLFSLQKTLDQLMLAGPSATPPATLKDKVLGRLQAQAGTGSSSGRQSLSGAPQGLRFHGGSNAD